MSGASEDFGGKEFLFGKIREDLVSLLDEPMQGVLFKSKSSGGQAVAAGTSGDEPGKKRRRVKLNEQLVDTKLDSCIQEIKFDSSGATKVDRKKVVFDETLAGLV